MKRKTILCLVIVILLLIVLRQKTIPKVIWTYWDDPDTVPKTVKTCIEGWKKYNPDYTICLLHKSSLKDYHLDFLLHEKQNTDSNKTRLADMIRINLLKKYGGFWVDSSIICNKSLNWIIDIQKKHNVECVIYYLDGFTEESFKNNSPVVENWFIACVKGSRFIRDWCDEFMKINNYDDVNDYVSSVTDSGVSLQKIYDPGYLAMHVSAQKILQQPNNYRLAVMRAEDGPYLYQADNTDGDNWNIPKAIDALQTGKYNYLPLIKLRGCERSYMENNNIELK
jgi:hypothetical protein